jgi:hypothetical protein
MAVDKTISEPASVGVGQPPRDSGRSADILLTEVAKLQADGEHIKAYLAEYKADIKDLRERMPRLEERVAHLPSKGFIIVVITTALVILGGFLTVMPKLQAALTGQSPPTSTSAH